VGDPVGWLMDTRVPNSPTPDPNNGQDGWIDAQQGPGDNKPVLARHPAGNVLNFRDTGNNDNLLVFDQDLALTDGVNGLANNNVATLLLAARVDPAGTGNSYLIDFRDDAPIGGGADAVNGFSLRYNHTEGLLEGMIKQSVAVSLPVEAGSWFAARLVWNGPSTTASLTVETLAGVQSTGGAADATALLSDRLRLGNNSAGNSGMLGQLGDDRSVDRQGLDRRADRRPADHQHRRLRHDLGRRCARPGAVEIDRRQLRRGQSRPQPGRP
jgi:hypothetical protein